MGAGRPLFWSSPCKGSCSVVLRQALKSSHKWPGGRQRRMQPIGWFTNAEPRHRLPPLRLAHGQKLSTREICSSVDEETSSAPTLGGSDLPRTLLRSKPGSSRESFRNALKGLVPLTGLEPVTPA